MARSVIKLAYDTCHDSSVVSLRFEKDYSIISKVKTIKGAVWSQSRGFWYIPSNDFNLSEVFDILSSEAYLDYSAIENIQKVSGEGIIATNKEDSNKLPIENKASPTVDIFCDEKQKTFYLSLPFALKEPFKKLEGAWWHSKLKQWSALDTEDNREQLAELLHQARLSPKFLLSGVKKQFIDAS